MDAHLKLDAKCEDRARENKLDADAKNDGAMEVGNVDDAGSESQQGAGGWEAAGWAGEEGRRWPGNCAGQNDGEMRC